MAKAFSSSLSHFAVSGLSARMKKDMMAITVVMMPSMAKIIRHVRKLPKLFRLKMPDARSPPKAPASGAMTMNKESRKASSLRRYHRER